MKRIGLPITIFLSWMVLIGAASAQTAGGEGWPPQSELFSDALNHRKQ